MLGFPFYSQAIGHRLSNLMDKIVAEVAGNILIDKLIQALLFSIQVTSANAFLLP